MVDQITCGELASLMAGETLHAVCDVRERGEFNQCHIAGSTSLPRSQIEFRIADLVPDASIKLVLYDDDGARVKLACDTLERVGYKNVALLEGGLAAWTQADYPSSSGVNVPSKAFGERVYHDAEVPEITPQELRRLQLARERVVILDVRTPEEYRRFCIPGGVNVPGGDLILWAEELKQKSGTAIVVNCAGRTRSIVGTAALRRLGLGNVRALKNGTMGWVLAGLDLETKPTRAIPEPPRGSREKSAALGLRIAEEEGIPLMTATELSAIYENKNTEPIYLVDVRSEDEYAAGHLPRSLNIPGGQAVQRADDFIAVRRGRIVFVSGQGARAVMAAYWYRRMGFPHAAVLRGGLDAWGQNGGAIVSGFGSNSPLGLDAARTDVRFMAASELKSRLDASPISVVDVGSSPEFEAGHLPGAKWVSRGWLEFKVPEALPDKSRMIVLSCPDGQNSIFAARSLKELRYDNVFVLDGGVKAWSTAGYAVETGLTSCLSEPIDVVFSPSVRGTKEDMRRYLEWEEKLV